MNPDALAEPDIQDDQIYGPNQPTQDRGPQFHVHAARVASGSLLAVNTRVVTTSRLAWPTPRLAVRSFGPAATKSYGIAGEAPVTSSVAWDGTRTHRPTARALRPPDSRIPTSGRRRRTSSRSARVSLNAPLPDELIPGARRVRRSRLPGRNVFRWTNDDWTHFDPEMGGNNDNNPISRDGAQPGSFLVTSISEHIPAPAIWTIALRVNF